MTPPETGIVPKVLPYLSGSFPGAASESRTAPGTATSLAPIVATPNHPDPQPRRFRLSPESTPSVRQGVISKSKPSRIQENRFTPKANNATP